ncbi:MAG: hypothetical protein WCC03_04585 [Candidatus Acidiferrales bacterium]
MPRRIPSFPVSFEISRPTRFSKAQSKMYFANEWEEYQKSLHHDDVASTSAPADAPQPIATPNDTHATVSPVAENTGAIAAPASSPASVSPPPGTVHSQLLGSGRRPLLPPDFSRHARRCCICSHPDRDAIEGDFIRWHSVELIAREYKIATRKSIYRHAHCTGLFAWRRRVLEGILENAEHVPLVSSGVIVRAARIYAHLDENGNWFEPAHTNFTFTAPASSLSPLGSNLLANSARAKPRPAKPRKIRTSSNRNNRSFRKKLKSLNKKEKANS